MARKTIKNVLYTLDPLTAFKASRMPAHGASKTQPTSNFLKHKGGEGRHFDYEMLNHSGKTLTWEQWVKTGTKAVESYPNYGKRGGKSAVVSATRMLYSMRREGFFIKV